MKKKRTKQYGMAPVNQCSDVILEMAPISEARLSLVDLAIENAKKELTKPLDF